MSNLSKHLCRAIESLFSGFLLAGPSDDGVAAAANPLRWEAQSEAASVDGFSGTHRGILSDPKASDLPNGILRQAGAR
jgi:hypothetical protein